MTTRIQRQRRKGQPGYVHLDGRPLSESERANAVCCTRPERLGNPFSTAAEYRYWMVVWLSGYKINVSMEMLDAMLIMPKHAAPQLQAASEAIRSGELTGKNLACWCGADDECHVDVLIDLISHYGGGG